MSKDFRGTTRYEIDKILMTAKCANGHVTAPYKLSYYYYYY